MNAPIDQQQLRAMSVSERLRLLEDVWSSLADHPDALAVPDWHRAELDARRATGPRSAKNCAATGANERAPAPGGGGGSPRRDGVV